MISDNNIITIKNDRLHYQWLKHREGKVQFPVIIMLHEGLGSIPQWKDFPEKVARLTGLDILLYERTGYGQSSPLIDKREIDYLQIEAKQLGLLIQQLEIPEYYLIGHSEGGTIGLLHASENPSGLRGLITLSANVKNEPKISIGIKSVMEKYWKNGSKMKSALVNYHKEKTDEIFKAWSETWTAPMFQKFNIENYIVWIKTPILALHGINDLYTSLNQINLLSEHVEGSVDAVVLNDCGHHPHFEQEEEVLRKIGQFISDDSP